jgi:hypothetical protein
MRSGQFWTVFNLMVFKSSANLDLYKLTFTIIKFRLKIFRTKLFFFFISLAFKIMLFSLDTHQGALNVYISFIRIILICTYIHSDFHILVNYNKINFSDCNCYCSKYALGFIFGRLFTKKTSDPLS